MLDTLGSEKNIYKLEQVQISCGNKSIPTVFVSVIDPQGKKIIKTGTGVGPVDAVFKVLRKITGIKCQLLEYSLDAVTKGTDALATVRVKIESQGRTFTAQAADDDIIVASTKVYLNALNLIARQKK